jgi:hypothetical protein
MLGVEMGRRRGTGWARQRTCTSGGRRTALQQSGEEAQVRALHCTKSSRRCESGRSADELPATAVMPRRRTQRIWGEEE